MLPELPKKRSRKEFDVTPLVFKWFLDNYNGNVALEIKVKGGKVKDHQMAALKQVEKGAFTYKFPDMGRRNPFDGIVLKECEAYIVVCDGRLCNVYDLDMCYEFSIKV